MQTSNLTVKKRIQNLAPSALLCLVGIAINLLGAQLAGALGLPLYIDCLGTVLAAALGGYLPGIAVGYISNLIGSIFYPTTVYYGALSVVIAVLSTASFRLGYFKRPVKLLIPIAVSALICGILGSVLDWMLNGFTFGDSASAAFAQVISARTGMGVYPSQLSADILTNLADKGIAFVLAAVILRLIPEPFQVKLRFRVWQQTPLSDEALEEVSRHRVRRLSLRARLVIMITIAALLVAGGATGISTLLYHKTSVEEHTKLAQGVVALVASAFDPERVQDFVALGEEAEGYLEAEQRLYTIRDSTVEIEYVYVYRIEEDGCHVVFDLDTDELEGSAPGDVIPFDDSFTEYLPALFAGEAIDPIITDDTYGWLLTAYQPVYNAAGECQCYAAVDISMGMLTQNEVRFMARLVSIYLGLFLLILVLGLQLAEYYIILPINTMASSADDFAFTSEAEREHSLKRLKELGISTGDEIENLYVALSQTTGDSLHYISDIQKKNATISKMQNGLILVLADMVESRDKCTGDHVRKTAAYTRAILNQLRADGVYTEMLTDGYIDDVTNSAPLHDVGKIQVPDSILNKPGKLTEEEFNIMKGHTTAGGTIIAEAISLVSEAGYLEEAKNLATYHHERWDGTGYPSGLVGESIPLSARVMAVADVFDALVSRRSYKAPFSFEKAMSIIQEESGTHFDPQVVAAFVHAEPEIRRISEMYFET